MLILWVALTTCITYDVSLDKTEVNYYGQNEELSQVDAQKPGAFSQYKIVNINSGIIGLGHSCLSGFTNMISLKLFESCKYFKGDALASCTSLKTIILPEGFEDLGQGSFFSCTSLTSISFPSTLKYIESPIRTFQFCKSLEKFIFPQNNLIFSALDNGKILVENNTIMLSVAGAFPEIVIPAQVETISLHTFSGRETVTSVTFEKGSKLKYIGAAAFRYTSIKSMIIPEGTETLMNSLWEYTESFTEVSLPSSLIYVHADIFSSADNLNVVTCVQSNGIIIDSNEIIYNQDKTVIFVPSDAELFSITKDTTKIPAQAIQTKRNLKNITVEDNHGVYYAINNLLYLVKSKALYACPGGITEAIIERECTSISSFAFKSSSVVNVTFLGNAVTTIGKQAFFKAYNLTYINLPDSITSIDDVGLHSTGFLGQTVVMPSSLNNMGKEAFRLSNVKRIDMHKCTQLTEIKDETFRGAQYLEHIDLPPNLESIATNSFISCQSLKSIKFPASLLTIQLYAFQSCTSLQTVEFESVSKCHTIQGSAFKDCDIRTISLPDSITLLEAEAFSGNKNLETLNFSINSQLKEIRASVIQNCKAMKEITFGPKLETFLPAALAFSPGLVTLTVSENNPNFIAIDNVLYTKDTTKVVACPGGLTTTTIKGGVTMFCDSAFYGCSLLKSIEFGDVPLALISSSAFYGCTSLKLIEIPASVENIMDNAFNGCNELSNVVFKNGAKLLSLGSSAFNGCKKLSKVIFEGEANLKEICPSAFASCEMLESFAFPQSVETIGDSAFLNCHALTSVYFHPMGSLQSIGTSAFKGCSSIKKITLPESLSSLGANAFSDCAALSIIGYCGVHDLSKNSAFLNSKQVRAYSRFDYSYATIGGLQPIKFLDEDCMIPTGNFTPNGDIPVSETAIMLIAAVIQSDDI